ncbi:MAG TPA: PAS domain-containing protein [Methanofastidiosum sp.]|jgi:PAS domain S-box-containing protein|nr:PAS domain-containing protein [Methanofastidiosum sp.]
MIGKLEGKMLESILDTIPIEFSVLDENDKVLAWNKHETRIFKRPEAALGRDVKQCHPERSLDKVEKIIGEMKEGIRDKARFWIDLPLSKNGEKEKVMIEYYAIRDKEGNYLGCLEASQNIAEIQKLEGQKRLLE